MQTFDDIKWAMHIS